MIRFILAVAMLGLLASPSLATGKYHGWYKNHSNHSHHWRKKVRRHIERYVDEDDYVNPRDVEIEEDRRDLEVPEVPER